MTLEKKLCAVCAWRRNCQKKFSSSSSGVSGALYCSDFTKDLSIKDDPTAHIVGEKENEADIKKKDKYWKW
jgi:hypothetical protein